MEPFYPEIPLWPVYVLDFRRIPRIDDAANMILVPDGWNDYGYTTLYDAYYRPNIGVEAILLGGVRIAYPGLQHGERPLQAGYYQQLPNNCFSLGVSADYYIELSRIEPTQRYSILASLNDIAFSDIKLQQAGGHEVTELSLLRSISYPMITGQFRRIISGLDILQEYNFSYITNQSQKYNSTALTFSVDPYSKPPTNIHALIGRNGVGKTTILKRIAQALIEDENHIQAFGAVTDLDNFGSPNFSNIVSVSFSAFDPFRRVNEVSSSGEIHHHYVGLHDASESSNLSTKGPTQLEKELLGNFESIAASGHIDVWNDLVELLENDPGIEKYNLKLDERNSSDDSYSSWMQTSSDTAKVVSEMSSGHKIVLLTLSALVDKVGERSLVLIDEPESHLHPPLLSSFIRSLSRLLTKRNGVAIIATHSPVVIQEIPRSCVWNLLGPLTVSSPQRPPIETFGGSVGEITHAVFRLELEGSGFYREILQAVQETQSYEGVLDRFNHQLGSEARSLARALVRELSEHQQ